jgi:hypothetical protein
MDGFCAQCGTSLANATRFCGGCGVALDAGQHSAAAGLGWAYYANNRAAPAAELGAVDDSAVTTPGTDTAAWRAAYSDTFLSEPLTLVTTGEARQRDFPTADGSTVQSTLNAGEQLSGRWVRGRDPATRWLKLTSGGYVWEGNLAVPGGPGSPIAIPFNNANEGFGPEIGTFLDQASAAARARYERADRLPEGERERFLDSIETASTYVRVPNRRFRGLTVTGVGVHYEASSIYFAENVATVRAAWRVNGLVIDPDGNVPLPDSEAGSCSIGSTTHDDRPYGATALTCGV